MKTIFAVLCGLVIATGLSAADTNTMAGNASTWEKISSYAATNYYDKTVIVTGKVVQVTIRPTVTFINLDKPFPNSPFEVVIFHQHSSFYGDANALNHHDIEIAGKITKFKDRPEMSLNSLDQLKVVGVTNLKAFLKPKASPPPKDTKDAPSTATNLPEIM